MIKAIQTHYKGYKFRSRTEARWAVFFEKLGYNWKYEEEGYILDDGTHYLPDFTIYTPDNHYYVEVKGSNVIDDSKWNSFQRCLGYEVGERSALVSGDPYSFFVKDNLFVKSPCPRCGMFHNIDGGDSLHIDGWYLCEPCDPETPFGGENPVMWDGLHPYRPHKGWVVTSEYWDASLGELNAWFKLFKKAVRLSRSARFEHGETP